MTLDQKDPSTLFVKRSNDVSVNNARNAKICVVGAACIFDADEFFRLSLHDVFRDRVGHLPPTFGSFICRSSPP